MDWNLFCNLSVELGILERYLVKLELGLDILGETLGNLTARWRSWERHLGND